jgi:oligoendopeptidase F
MTAFDRETYRSQAEAFTGELDGEYYRHFAGLKEACDFSSIYGRYARLFTREAVDTLGELRESEQGQEKKRLDFLHEFAVEGFMGEQTKELTDEIANLESELTITVDGEQIGYRQSSVALANEADADRRRRLNEARLDVTRERLNPRYLEQWQVLHGLAGDLGYRDYAGLYSDVRAVDFEMLRATTDSFLHDTEGLYQRSLDRMLGKTLGVTLDQVHYADLAYFMRAPQFDDVFAADRLLPTFDRLLADVGIDLGAQQSIHVDAEPRERKSPRAFCAPIHVPDEIYLVVMPKGGQDDFGALLHEGGHAEHFANTRADLPFEYRYLGDNAVTEGFAFLFDHLLLNPRWLERYLEFGDSAAYLEFANVVELYFLRRYAGKLAYETRLHAATGPLEGLGETYRELLTSAVQVEVPADNYLVDVDPGFYCSSYLRAWLFEAALRMLFQDRFGMEWYRDPEAGAWLKDLWSHGQEFSADQLLLKNGGGGLDAGPLRQHLERALGR